MVDSLVLDYPDAKFLLFETHVDDWIRRVSVKATEAARLGAECGCVGENAVRSSRPKCGDSTHHYCDLYPCLWEQQFATREVDPLAWREAYINHVAKVKTSVPSERLLVVPMLADQSPVAVGAAVGSFVELTAAPEEFAAAHPFEPHIMDLRREQGWSVVLFIAVGVLGLALLFVPNPYAGARQSGYSATSATERRVGGERVRARARAWRSVSPSLRRDATMDIAPELFVGRRDRFAISRRLQSSSPGSVLGDDLEPSRHFARRVARVSRGSTRSAHGDTIEVWKVRREMRRVSSSRPHPSPGPASSRSAGTTASPSTCSG